MVGQLAGKDPSPNPPAGSTSKPPSMPKSLTLSPAEYAQARQTRQELAEKPVKEIQTQAQALAAKAQEAFKTDRKRDAREAVAQTVGALAAWQSHLPKSHRILNLGDAGLEGLQVTHNNHQD